MPAAVAALIWAEDRYRNGALYAFCDELPITAYAPLRNQIFTAGCYIESACHAGEYRVSMELSAYEVLSLHHCGNPRVQRPDRALMAAIKRWRDGPERFRFPINRPQDENLEFTELAN